jgi:hypothetical protein
MKNLEDYIEFLEHLKTQNKTILDINLVIESLKKVEHITNEVKQVERPIVENKYTKKEWYQTYNTSKERGVRSESGFIAIMPKPSYYHGQEERYMSELEEYKANANLISQAPKMHQLCEAFFDTLQNTSSIHLPILDKVLNEVNPK